MPRVGHSPGPRRIGRYTIADEIAAGGVATVHVGRAVGSVGFARTVAIKRLHPQFAKAPEFVSMFTDEARLAARIHHPNVATTLDVVSADGELFLVMEYVHGESLAKLIRACSKRGAPVPVPIAMSIAIGALSGLHAAHEATTEGGAPLEVVHRDISPQNIMVGVDGVARILDFGVAKAVGRLAVTREGQIKGKIAYMAPEQLRSHPVDRRVDVYAMSVVLWETLTGQRLFVGDSDVAVWMQVLEADVPPPSQYSPAISSELDAIVLRGLSRDPAHRFATAAEMAHALERFLPAASAGEVGQWVYATSPEGLAARQAVVADIERSAPESENPSAADLASVSTVTAKPTQSHWQKPAVAAAALVVMTAAAVTVGFYEKASHGPRGETTYAGLVSTSPPVASSATKLKETISADAAPQTSTKTVEIDTRPSGATIVVDGEPRGTTPARLPLAGPVSVELRLRGFATARRTLDPAGSDPSHVVTLVREIVHAPGNSPRRAGRPAASGDFERFE